MDADAGLEESCSYLDKHLCSGTGGHINTNMRMKHVCRGTSSFAAPEVCRRLHNISTEVLTQQIDIWSLGITLFEVSHV